MWQLMRLEYRKLITSSILRFSKQPHRQYTGLSAIHSIKQSEFLLKLTEINVFVVYETGEWNGKPQCFSVCSVTMVWHLAGILPGEDGTLLRRGLRVIWACFEYRISQQPSPARPLSWFSQSLTLRPQACSLQPSKQSETNSGKGVGSFLGSRKPGFFNLLRKYSSQPN